MRPLVLFVAVLCAVPAEAKLPGRIAVSIDAHRASRLYQRAVEGWNDAFRIEELAQITDEIRAVGPKGLSGKTVDRLKTLRKHGAILRASFVSLAAPHEAPPVLDELVTEFGKLNDAIDHHVHDEAIDRAARLGQLLEAQPIAALERELAAFVPASRTSFDRHVATTLGDVRARIQQSPLPAREFHEVRKSLKAVLAVLHLLTLDPDASADVREAYDHLNAVNDELGKRHDDAVGRGLRGKDRYKKIEIEIPPHLRETVDKLAARFQNI